MKNLITVVAIIMVTSVFAQSNNLKGEVKLGDNKIENMSISVEVDSAEEIESTFSIKDFEELLDITEKGEELSFKIKCNGKTMSNGVKSSMSYEIKGNTNDKKEFLKNIKKLRKAAIKYYKSKE
ncbi:hypothetical protein DFQ05_1252 [Winogradskyella wandonensis]|uniref:Uncharacterized protein n=1 Tax=Winogradskyella wandonensis TaxID=1442586 RepID=A0A4R1KQZ3_9FLAO|nr:hypothetical protein [Winogradskyella wandonensis]TCK67476.1 hypothetical protein DFQ05_1252 [Winogradskyella wandonensis]